VQIEPDGKPVAGFRSRKALALLGYLAVQDHPIPRQQLADLLWGDLPEARGRANLSWVLNRISSLLPGCLEADRHTIRFSQAPPYPTDTSAFQALVARGDAASLATAVDLVRGEFLEGLYLDGCPEFELWLVSERERWHQRTSQVLRDLVAHHDQGHDHAQALRYARQLLALEPWREEAHRQVMRLLADDGQRSAALAQYEICRRILAEELGIEPAPATVRLYEQIRDAQCPPSTPRHE
jgi:DNA-binding SARP family transcriptional activator